MTRSHSSKYQINLLHLLLAFLQAKQRTQWNQGLRYFFPDQSSPFEGFLLRIFSDSNTLIFALGLELPSVHWWLFVNLDGWSSWPLFTTEFGLTHELQEEERMEG